MYMQTNYLCIQEVTYYLKQMALWGSQANEPIYQLVGKLTGRNN